MTIGKIELRVKNLRDQLEEVIDELTTYQYNLIHKGVNPLEKERLEYYIGSLQTTLDNIHSTLKEINK